MSNPHRSQVRVTTGAGAGHDCPTRQTPSPVGKGWPTRHGFFFLAIESRTTATDATFTFNSSLIAPSHRCQARHLPLKLFRVIQHLFKSESSSFKSPSCVASRRQSITLQLHPDPPGPLSPEQLSHTTHALASRELSPQQETRTCIISDSPSPFLHRATRVTFLSSTPAPCSPKHTLLLKQLQWRRALTLSLEVFVSLPALRLSVAQARSSPGSSSIIYSLLQWLRLPLVIRQDIPSCPHRSKQSLPNVNGLGWPGESSIFIFIFIFTQLTLSRLNASPAEKAAHQKTEKRLAAVVCTVLECISEDPDQVVFAHQNDMPGP